MEPTSREVVIENLNHEKRNLENEISCLINTFPPTVRDILDQEFLSSVFAFADFTSGLNDYLEKHPLQKYKSLDTTKLKFCPWSSLSKYVSFADYEDSSEIGTRENGSAQFTAGISPSSAAIFGPNPLVVPEVVRCSVCQEAVLFSTYDLHCKSCTSRLAALNNATAGVEIQDRETRSSTPLPPLPPPRDNHGRFVRSQPSQRSKPVSSSHSRQKDSGRNSRANQRATSHANSKSRKVPSSTLKSAGGPLKMTFSTAPSSSRGTIKAILHQGEVRMDSTGQFKIPPLIVRLPAKKALSVPHPHHNTFDMPEILNSGVVLGHSSLPSPASQPLPMTPSFSPSSHLSLSETFSGILKKTDSSDALLLPTRSRPGQDDSESEVLSSPHDLFSPDSGSTTLHSQITKPQHACSQTPSQSGPEKKGCEEEKEGSKTPSSRGGGAEIDLLAGPLDPSVHCSVRKSNGDFCRRPLTCRYHSQSLKEQIARPKPFEILLAEVRVMFSGKHFRKIAKTAAEKKKKQKVLKNTSPEKERPIIRKSTVASAPLTTVDTAISSALMQFYYPEFKPPDLTVKPDETPLPGMFGDRAPPHPNAQGEKKGKEEEEENHGRARKRRRITLGAPCPLARPTFLFPQYTPTHPAEKEKRHRDALRTVGAMMVAEERERCFHEGIAVSAFNAPYSAALQYWQSRAYASHHKPPNQAGTPQTHTHSHPHTHTHSYPHPSAAGAAGSEFMKQRTAAGPPLTPRTQTRYHVKHNHAAQTIKSQLQFANAVKAGSNRNPSSHTQPQPPPTPSQKAAHFMQAHPGRSSVSGSGGSGYVDTGRLGTLPRSSLYQLQQQPSPHSHSHSQSTLSLSSSSAALTRGVGNTGPGPIVKNTSSPQEHIPPAAPVTIDLTGSGQQTSPPHLTQPNPHVATHAQGHTSGQILLSPHQKAQYLLHQKQLYQQKQQQQHSQSGSAGLHGRLLSPLQFSQMAQLQHTMNMRGPGNAVKQPTFASASQKHQPQAHSSLTFTYPPPSSSRPQVRSTERQQLHIGKEESNSQWTPSPSSLVGRVSLTTPQKFSVAQQPRPTPSSTTTPPPPPTSSSTTATAPTPSQPTPRDDAQTPCVGTAASHSAGSPALTKLGGELSTNEAQSAAASTSPNPNPNSHVPTPPQFSLTTLTPQQLQQLQQHRKYGRMAHPRLPPSAAAAMLPGPGPNGVVTMAGDPLRSLTLSASGSTASSPKNGKNAHNTESCSLSLAAGEKSLHIGIKAENTTV